MTDGSGTSGGWRGTSGARGRLAFVLALGFTVILVAVTIGDAESMISDFAAAGVPVSSVHVWTWEVTSVLAWLSTTPAIWWAGARVRPPRVGWSRVAAIALLGLPVASAWHIGVTIALRHLVYATQGESYRFQGALAHPYLYEFRKDVATYLQFVGLAVLAQWLLARAEPVSLPAPVAAEPGPRWFEVNDGAVTHRLPVEAIDHVAAAGNYVEIASGGRALLHRATLAAVEAELGEAFVRIHRSRLVRRAAIRRIGNERSGDFTVALEDGTELRGSRRFRAQLD